MHTHTHTLEIYNVLSQRLEIEAYGRSCLILCLPGLLAVLLVLEDWL